MQHSHKRDHKAITKTRFSDTQVHITTPKQVSCIIKPPPLLDAFVSNKFSQQRHTWLCKIVEGDFFFVGHVMILICYSKRCSVIVELLNHSNFLDKRLFMLFVIE